MRDDKDPSDVSTSPVLLIENLNCHVTPDQLIKILRSLITSRIATIALNPADEDGHPKSAYVTFIQFDETHPVIHALRSSVLVFGHSLKFSLIPLSAYEKIFPRLRVYPVYHRFPSIYNQLSGAVPALPPWFQSVVPLIMQANNGQSFVSTPVVSGHVPHSLPFPRNWGFIATPSQYVVPAHRSFQSPIPALPAGPVAPSRYFIPTGLPAVHSAPSLEYSAHEEQNSGRCSTNLSVERWFACEPTGYEVNQEREGRGIAQRRKSVTPTGPNREDSEKHQLRRNSSSLLMRDSCGWSTPDSQVSSTEMTETNSSSSLLEMCDIARMNQVDIEAELTAIERVKSHFAARDVQREQASLEYDQEHMSSFRKKPTFCGFATPEPDSWDENDINDSRATRASSGTAGEDHRHARGGFGPIGSVIPEPPSHVLCKSRFFPNGLLQGPRQSFGRIGSPVLDDTGDELFSERGNGETALPTRQSKRGTVYGPIGGLPPALVKGFSDSTESDVVYSKTRSLVEASKGESDMIALGASLSAADGFSRTPWESVDAVRSMGFSNAAPTRLTGSRFLPLFRKPTR